MNEILTWLTWIILYNACLSTVLALLLEDDPLLLEVPVLPCDGVLVGKDREVTFLRMPGVKSSAEMGSSSSIRL